MIALGAMSMFVGKAIHPSSWDMFFGHGGTVEVDLKTTKGEAIVQRKWRRNGSFDRPTDHFEVLRG
jgi:hypothetical protein